jgi:hypothetical protein
MTSQPLDCTAERAANPAGRSRDWRQWPRVSAALLNVWPYRAVRVTLALVFLWTGIAKLADPTSFVVIIDAYGLIPDSWELPVALLLAALEALVGFALLFDIRGSLAIVAGLLALFMAILGYGIRLGLDIDCGCFGPEDPEAAAYHGLRPALLRDALMGFGIIYLYIWRYGRCVKPVSISRWINPIINRRQQQ